jgi:hypothetical protein
MSKAYYGISGSLTLKVEFYEELFEHFGSMDAEYVLWNLYFDEHAELLFTNLSQQLKQYCGERLSGVFLDIVDQRFPSYDDNRIKGFLKAYLTQRLPLEANEWESEGTNRNPVIERLAKWMTTSLQIDGADEALLHMVLHFSKLWNIYYARPYNYQKGLILFHKFFEQYNKLSIKDLRTDLSRCLDRSGRLLNALFVPIIHSPFTDPNETSFLAGVIGRALTRAEQVYLEKNKEFHQRIKEAAVYFQNLGMATWAELVKAAMNTTGEAKGAYIHELDRRYQANQLPKSNELVWFVQELEDNKDMSLSKDIIAKIVRDNYIFF